LGAEVVVNGLTKSFGRSTVWRDVSLTIPPGELSVIIGPSGTGKTVFLKSLIGLIKPERGEIRDIFLMTLAEVRARSFFYPQQVPEWQQLYGNSPTPAEADRAEEALETLVRLCWKPYMHELRLPFLLSRLKQSTLIVWGREDAIVPLECGELYQQHIAGSRLAVLDACGHCPHIEKPQAFADVVRPFLR